jgi:hypothetical protein
MDLGAGPRPRGAKGSAAVSESFYRGLDSKRRRGATSRPVAVGWNLFLLVRR